MPEVKCLVIKVRDNSMLLMSEEGEFRSLPLPEVPPRVGEQLTVPWPPGMVQLEDAPIRRGRRWSVPTWAAVAAAAVFLAIFSPLAYAQWSLSRPAAVVAVDINPSLELTVDGRQRVTQADALNADATELLSGLNLKGVPAPEALSRVVERASELGFIRKDTPATVVATVLPLKQGAKLPVPADLQQHAEDELAALGREGYVAVAHAQAPVLQEARTAGLSVNQYLAMERVRATGVQVTPAEVHGLKVREILALGGITPEAGFPGGKEVGRQGAGSGNAGGQGGPGQAGPGSHGNGSGGGPGEGGRGSSGGPGEGRKGGKGNSGESGDGKGRSGDHRDSNSAGAENSPASTDTKGNGAGQGAVRK